MNKRWNDDTEPVYTNPNALCSSGMLTLVWQLIGYSLKTQGKDENGRAMRWDITYQQCGDVIKYLKSIRRAHSTDGEIWNITADGKRALREYANELIGQFPQLKPMPKNNGVTIVQAATVATVAKPIFGTQTVATVVRKKRQHIKPSGSIPVGKPALTH